MGLQIYFVLPNSSSSSKFIYLLGKLISYYILGDSQEKPFKKVCLSQSSWKTDEWISPMILTYKKMFNYFFVI